MTHGNRQKLVAKLREGDPLTLRREPRNKHDRNAVAVHDRRGRHLGYLSAELAEDVAPRLDAGEAAVATVLGVTGGTRDAPTRGANIAVTVAAG